jgi:hypothetical protein
LLSAFVVVLVSPYAAVAQVATMAEALAEPFPIARPPADLDELTRLFNTSALAGLTRAARDILCVARRGPAVSAPADGAAYETCEELPSPRAAAGAVADALDTRRNHVALMWIGHDPFGTPQLLRFVVHEGRGDLNRQDLPGVSAGGRHGQLIEVFLSRSPQGRIVSSYTSRREDDPLAGQLPQFVQALAGPLFATVGAIAGRIAGEPESSAEPPPRLMATVKRVGLPFRRATVRLRASAREPISSAAFAAAARRLAASVSFTDVPHVACARDLAQRLAQQLPAATRSAACSGPAPDDLECTKTFDAALTGSMAAAAAGCDGGKPSREALQALTLVDKRFRALVQSGTATGAELDLTFRNRPPTHFAFGAGTAVIGEAWQTRPRVDTSGGDLIASPLPRVMTMAFVNWSPGGYDPDDDELSGAERWRVFVGTALTPDVGPVIGLNVLLVRGIGLTLGGAVLFGKGADAQELGGPPARPDDPYRLSIARAVFAGVSYNYK